MPVLGGKFIKCVDCCRRQVESSRTDQLLYFPIRLIARREEPMEVFTLTLSPKNVLLS